MDGFVGNNGSKQPSHVSYVVYCNPDRGLLAIGFSTYYYKTGRPPNLFDFAVAYDDAAN